MTAKQVGFGREVMEANPVVTTVTLTNEDIDDMQATLTALESLKTLTAVEILTGDFLTAQGVKFNVTPGEGAYEIRVNA